jgi:copper chaperone CopZ
MDATVSVTVADCEACRRDLLAALARVDGVLGARLDRDDGRASITFDPGRTNERAVIEWLHGSEHRPRQARTEDPIPCAHRSRATWTQRSPNEPPPR